MTNFVLRREVGSDDRLTQNWLVYENETSPIALVRLFHSPNHLAAYKGDWYFCQSLTDAAATAIKEALPKKIPPAKILDGPFEEVKEAVLSALKAHFTVT